MFRQYAVAMGAYIELYWWHEFIDRDLAIGDVVDDAGEFAASWFSRDNGPDVGGIVAAFVSEFRG